MVLQPRRRSTLLAVLLICCAVLLTAGCGDDPAPSGGSGPAADKDFRAIFGVHQQTLVSVMALEGSGITTPKSLTGKRIAAAANSVNQLLFPGYARLAGIDRIAGGISSLRDAGVLGTSLPPEDVVDFDVMPAR